ncbi:NmrA-like family protein [Zymoseptoria brevis]|uniref:NmrA-like family protein n=1 Tax=Zymoseptoria brevis TaxID=1047168 RepID=A0A0F4H208_9PEZI|nr:NmrA-like family protein [Zymoseptoria brevis]
MTSKKVIVVFGSTGNQGGSVINTVLSHSELASKYALRGVTRDASSPKSQALASKGVEMVTANVNDPSSLGAAVKGAYGVFAVTDFWSIFSKDKETAQGKAIVDASKLAGVKHLVWSGAPNVAKLSGGKYTHVDHFDGKAAVDEYVDANKGDMIVSHYWPAMFMDSLKQAVQNDAEGNFSLSIPFPDPDSALPLISPTRDTGNFVMGLLEAGEKADGVRVQGVSEWTTVNKLTETLREKTGKEATLNLIDVETYKSFLLEMVREDLGEMMQWIGESEYYGKGTKEEQADSDKFLLEGSTLTSWEKFVGAEF